MGARTDRQTDRQGNRTLTHTHFPPETHEKKKIEFVKIQRIDTPEHTDIQTDMPTSNYKAYLLEDKMPARAYMAPTGKQYTIDVDFVKRTRCFITYSIFGDPPKRVAIREDGILRKYIIIDGRVAIYI